MELIGIILTIIGGLVMLVIVFSRSFEWPQVALGAIVAIVLGLALIYYF
jgi:hypothetical protein